MSLRRPLHRPRGLPSLRRAPSAPAASEPAVASSPPAVVVEPPAVIAEASERRQRDTGHEPERRVRAAGGPEDHATYACRCGAVFPAAPTTSVSCPLCGIHQAW